MPSTTGVRNFCNLETKEFSPGPAPSGKANKTVIKDPPFDEVRTALNDMFLLACVAQKGLSSSPNAI